MPQIINVFSWKYVFKKAKKSDHKLKDWKKLITVLKKKKEEKNRLLDINNNNLHANNFIFFISYGSTHNEISDSHWKSNLVKFLSFVEQKQLKCTEEKDTNLCNISKTIYPTNTDYILKKP